MGHCHLISVRLEGRKKTRRTCDEDEAAIEGEEGSDAVEEVLEVDLILEEGRGAVGAAELHEPAGKIHAHLLVPEPTNKHYYNYYNNYTTRGGLDWIGRRRRNEWEQGLGKEIQPLRGIYSLEVLERELLLAGVEDVPEVLDPHRRRRRRSPEPEPEKKKKKTGSLTGNRNCGTGGFRIFFVPSLIWRNHSQTRLQSNTLFTR